MSIWRRKKLNIESKTGQNGHDLSNQKGPQQMQNFLHEEKIFFFCKIISLYTIKNLCVVIEIYAS